MFRLSKNSAEFEWNLNDKQLNMLTDTDRKVELQKELLIKIPFIIKSAFDDNLNSKQFRDNMKFIIDKYHNDEDKEINDIEDLKDKFSDIISDDETTDWRSISEEMNNSTDKFKWEKDLDRIYKKIDKFPSPADWSDDLLIYLKNIKQKIDKHICNNAEKIIKELNLTYSANKLLDEIGDINNKEYNKFIERFDLILKKKGAKARVNISKDGIFPAIELSEFGKKINTGEQKSILKLLNNTMATKGSPVDNSPIESFFSTLKAEFLYLNKPENVRDLHNTLTRWIAYYNNERIVTKLNDSPIEYRNKFD